MTATIDRPHILTDNETYGSKQRPPDEGGAWIVFDDESICAIFSNRQAAEDYIYDEAERERPAETYSLSVWTIHDTYPFDDE